MKGFFIQVAKGLHVIIGKALQLAKESSTRGGAVKYIEKNSRKLYM
jgi:hypothetical protein